MKVTVTKTYTRESVGEIERCPHCPLFWVEREYGLHMCDLIDDCWHNVPVTEIDKNCPLKGYQNPHVYITDDEIKIVEGE